MNDILVVIQNIIQYYSLRPLLLNLQKSKKWKFDIVLYGCDNTDGFEEIAHEVGTALDKDGFEFHIKPPKTEYKICLSPYQDMAKVKYKYLLGYCYGAATTKPYTTLLPEMKMKFHGMLLHDIYGADLFSVYAKTYIVSDLYLKKVTHHPVAKKPVLLYLPTYNEPCADEIASSLNKLHDKYYIIVKGHHGTNHLNNEVSRKSLLESVADEYYDSSFYAQDLFDRADVVLSDNSGAVMDALYINVPVCIAAKNINKSLADIDTLQYQLVKQKIIPYTDRLDQKSLDNLIQQTLDVKVLKAQIKQSDLLFPNKAGGVQSWIKVLEMYMNDRVSQNWCKLHDYYTKQNAETIALQQRCNVLENTLENVTHELEFYQTSRLHKIADRLYQLKKR